MESAAWLQAIASFFLVIITAVYVCLTYKLLHAPYKAFLKPISVRIKQNFGPTIKIRNLGPNLATNIRVKIVVLSDFTLDPLGGESLQGWAEYKLAKTHGLTEISPYKEDEYSFKDIAAFDKYPLFIQWETIIGKTQQTAWRINLGSDKEVVPINFYDQVKFKVKWLYRNNVPSYYQRIRKWWRFRKANQNK